SFDFIVKFPDGATIAPDQVIVVAMRGSGFTSTFGQAPDYAIIQAAPGAAMIDPGTLPGAAPGLTLTGASPQLTNSGEGVVLFHWDGASDLVSDIDMVAVAGAPSAINTLANKTGLIVDGPDADSAVSAYLTDAYTFAAMTGAAALGSSHKRIALESGYEQQGVGGNGLFGDDETSENFAITWDSPPFSAPTPGLVPTALLDGAFCGDGVVDAAAGEECDDGNTDNGDGCTATCQLAGCDDGLQNADEIDIDCGGHCGPASCQAGQVCTGDSDCGSGTCDAAAATCILTSTVSTGGEHTCVVLSDGAVRCWGANTYGQLGQGDGEAIGDDELPSVLANIDIGAQAIQVETGRDHSCALLDSGAVRCWGGNSFGQLGYGTTYDDGPQPESPAAAGDVPLGGTAVKIAAGSFHTCALLDTGALRCWGWNYDGQLGYGNTNSIGDNETPADAGDVPIGGVATDVEVGGKRTCVQMSGGGIRCWGVNSGMLGYGDTEYRGDDETPDTLGLVPVGGAVSQLAMGSIHTCALLDTGAVRCWGVNNAGQLGIGNTELIGDDEPASASSEVALGGPAIQIISGEDYSCALLADRTVRCWGWNYYGQLGYGNTDDIGDDELPLSAGPVPVGGPVYRLGRGGSRHMCVFMTSGSLRCWGRNNRGQLGHGNTGAVGNNEFPADVGDVPYL
ncbi:MAG: hypothetical protein AAGC55_15770, partial [Myxococcota bacterium]